MIEWMIMVAGFAILAVLCAILMMQIARLRRTLAQGDSQREASLRQIHEDMRALCAGSAALGAHLASLDQRLQRLSDQQRTLELREPGSQSYGFAIRLAQQGASVEELMENCGMSRGEAELLLRLHHAHAA